MVHIRNDSQRRTSKCEPPRFFSSQHADGPQKNEHGKCYVDQREDDCLNSNALFFYRCICVK